MHAGVPASGRGAGTLFYCLLLGGCRTAADWQSATGAGRLVDWKADERILWRFQTSSDIHSSPALGDDVLYCGSDDGWFTAHDPGGGLRWKADVGAAVRSSAIVGRDGTVFVAICGSELYAFTPEGEKRWKIRLARSIRSTPSIGNDRVLYIGTSDGLLYAIDGEGGTADTYSFPDAIYSSPAVNEDGIPFIGTDDGCIDALKIGSPGPERYSWSKFRGGLENTGNTASLGP